MVGCRNRRSRPEVGILARDTATLARAIRLVAGFNAFGKARSRAWDIPHHPVKNGFSAATKTDVEVVHDQGEALGRWRSPGPRQRRRNSHRAAVFCGNERTVFI